MSQAEQPKWMTWAGRVASALPVLALAASASMKLSHAQQVVDMFTGKFGFPESVLRPIGIVEVACAIIYLIPQTAVLGAILLTGYLGGAVVTHVRVGEPFIAPAALGVLVWAGLYLRDARVRALIPLRRPT